MARPEVAGRQIRPEHEALILRNSEFFFRHSRGNDYERKGEREEQREQNRYRPLVSLGNRKFEDRGRTYGGLIESYDLAARLVRRC